MLKNNTKKDKKNKPPPPHHHHPHKEEEEVIIKEEIILKLKAMTVENLNVKNFNIDGPKESVRFNWKVGPAVSK